MTPYKPSIQAGLVLLVTLLSTAAQGIQPGAPKDGDETQIYIVEFIDPPLAAYDGGETYFGEQFPAFASKAGAQSSPKAPARQAYLDYLDRARQRILSQAGFALKSSTEAKHIYRHAFNGVALELTPQQARHLAQQPGVASVSPRTAAFPPPTPVPSGLAFRASGPVRHRAMYRRPAR